MIGLVLALALGGQAKPVLSIYGPRLVLGSPAWVEVLVSAEISGSVTEAYYCPKVEWTISGALGPTVSTQEADCPPWPPDDVADVPYRWTRRVRVDITDCPAKVIHVELIKGGRRLLAATGEIAVAGCQ